MLRALAFLLLAADPAPAGERPEATTIPRTQDSQPYETRDTSQGTPTDPLFDRQLVATDDPTFILSAVESSRQAALDARTLAKDLTPGPLRDTATAIGSQNEATTRKLEALAKRKGWRLPESNPDRSTGLPVAGKQRTGANFIVSQISSHQTTVAQYRAQIAGKGDPELKSTLQQALPGYQKNLSRLLAAKP